MKRKKGVFFISAGLLLIIAALLLTIYNFLESYQAGRSSKEALKMLEMYLEEDNVQTDSLYEQYQGIEMPTYEIDGTKYIGILEIPALGRELPIISEWSRENLKMAVCRYKGSAYTGDFILAGHNYRAHFGGLSKLVIGDSVKFVDANGNQFLYEVLELEKMPGTAVDSMEAGEWDLTLFTCGYNGENRIAVRCTRVE